MRRHAPLYLMSLIHCLLFIPTNLGGCVNSISALSYNAGTPPSSPSPETLHPWMAALLRCYVATCACVTLSYAGFICEFVCACTCDTAFVCVCVCVCVYV